MARELPCRSVHTGQPSTALAQDLLCITPDGLGWQAQLAAKSKADWLTREWHNGGNGQGCMAGSDQPCYLCPRLGAIGAPVSQLEVSDRRGPSVEIS